MAGVIRIISETQLDGDGCLKSLLDQHLKGVSRYVVIVAHDDDERRINLSDVHLTNLIELLRRVKAYKLELVRVNFEGAPQFKRNFNSLREITLQECHRSFDFIADMIVACPRLKSFHDHHAVLPGLITNYWRQQQLTLTGILKTIDEALKVNYHLTNFDPVTIEATIKDMVKSGLRGDLKRVLNR